MNFRKEIASCAEVKQVDMVSYLSSLGYEPAKIRDSDYWYLSPLRQENTPSFKINRRLNLWYDHGLGKGGNLIDFAILYNNCTVGEILNTLHAPFSFHQPQFSSVKDEHVSSSSQLQILEIIPIRSFSLQRYLNQRRIAFKVAERFCTEVKYCLKDQKFYAIGFKNSSGGYELRNAFYKGSCAPKDVTILDNSAKEVAVFEGFFDFLSFMTLLQNEDEEAMNFMVLNSIALFEKARSFMEQHEVINLYLDHDKTGQNCTQYALSLSDKYKDRSCLYQHHKDLNDWMMNFGKHSE